MEVKETKLKGCYLINPRVFNDHRGEFFEVFKKNEFEALLGQRLDFVQDNHSVSRKGVLRGLHFQEGENAQAKLVRVVKGEVLDVVVDLREESPTYGQHYKTRLSSTNRKILFIPRGMAHGFLSLTEEAIFTYKCDNYYNMKEEAGIIFNDPDLNIDWEYPTAELILSDKDLELPYFKDSCA